MLGYMSPDEARKLGFTHHGRYFGIPLWIGDPDGNCLVAVKWSPLNWVMDLFHGIEDLVRAIAFPEALPCFQFSLGDEIKK